MPSVWAIALLVPAVFVAFVDWRKGLYAMLVVAFLQDPARKLEPSQPIYFTVLVGAVFALAYVRAQVGALWLPAQMPGWKRHLGTPFKLFILLLVVQAAHSMGRYGNPVVAAIGALSYLAPLPAMLAGYHLAIRSGSAGVQRWLTWYLAGAMIVLPSILLQYAGFEWGTLGQVGVGFEMYMEDSVLTAHSGFFRASETAAWHTATAVCCLLMLSSMRRLSTRQIVMAVTIIVVLLMIGVLTGRRKVFVEVLIFICTYLALLLLFGKGGSKLAAAIFAGGLLSYGAVMFLVSEQPSDAPGSERVAYGVYAARSRTVGSDVSERVEHIGVNALIWALQDYGWTGGGLGIASQGAQTFIDDPGAMRGSSEGGLGKIAAELGVPGLLLSLWLGVAAVLYGWNVLLFVSSRSSAAARLAYGLVALLMANLAVFFVATQVFGDLFVLLFLGLVSGFFLATPVLAEREHAGATAARSRIASPRTPAVGGAPIARGTRQP